MVVVSLSAARLRRQSEHTRSGMSSLQDAQLLERIALGDAQAFEAFYHLYGPRVLAYVRMLAVNNQQVEDVVQDVFLAVWRKAASYRPEFGGVSGWLFSITRNRLVDLWRRQGGRVAEEDFDLTTLEAGEPDEASRLAAVAVRQALLRLNPDQQEAIRLAYFGGLTYEETAKRLRIPLGTLKSRIRAGLQTLREWLSEPAETPVATEREV